MHLSLPLLLLLGASETLAHVTLTKTVRSTKLTTQTCATGYKKSKKNGAIPTSTVTSTKKIPKLSITYKNSVPVKTVTPKPNTSTMTVIATSVTTKTDPAVTDTFSTTSTVLTTLTSTTTLTAVNTIIDTASTTVTSTTQIPTPSGYIPIQESSGETNYVEPAPPKARSVGHPRGSAAYRSPLEARGRSLCPAPAKYPSNVRCTKYVQTEYVVEIIVIKPTSTKTLRPVTTSVTSTSTYVSTSTVVPHASTTETFSITSTFSASATAVTSTTTHTTTTVTIAPVATRLAACDADVLGPRVNNGNYLYTFSGVDSSATIQYLSVNNAYDCCAACFNTPNCLYGGVAPGSNDCEIAIANSCPAGQPLTGRFDETTGTNGYNGVYYFNGPCGSMTRGGVF